MIFSILPPPTLSQSTLLKNKIILNGKKFNLYVYDEYPTSENKVT